MCGAPVTELCAKACNVAVNRAYVACVIVAPYHALTSPIPANPPAPVTLALNASTKGLSPFGNGKSTAPKFEEISAELSNAKIGQEFKVIIDRKEGEYYIGRTQFDSPEVDPEVLIKAEGKRLFSGRFYRVRITNADDFDLFGEVI